MRLMRRVRWGYAGFLATGRGRVTAAAESSGVVAHVDFEEVEWFRNANTPEEFAELMDDGE